MGRVCLRWVAALVAAGALGVTRGDVPGSTLIDIAFVDVLAPGGVANSADLRYSATGYGSVGYDYRIGMYEVTMGQYAEFLNATAASDPYGLYNTQMAHPVDVTCPIQRSGSYGSYTYSVAGDWANRPVGWVSWYDAARFCNWLTTQDTEQGVYDTSTWAINRNYSSANGVVYALPTEDEWYKAAYYSAVLGEYFDYPTGTNTLPSNVLGEATDPGNSATYYNQGYTVGYPYYRTEVGAHLNSASPYGTFDQGGNVWEWNETLYQCPYLPGPSPYAYIRGGSYDTSYLGEDVLAASYRNGNGPTAESASLGFRVASFLVVPEPGSLGLLLLGLAGMVVRRRRVSR